MKEEVVKEHLENLVNAMVALTPSRNLITQFLFMIDKEEHLTLQKMYPEILGEGNKKEELKKFLNSYHCNQLKKFVVDTVFNLLGNEEVIESLSKLLEKDEKEIYNPQLEWQEVLLNAISKERTYGKVAIQLLKILIEKDREFSYSDLIKRAKIDESTFRGAIKLLVGYNFVDDILSRQSCKLSNNGWTMIDKIKELS